MTTLLSAKLTPRFSSRSILLVVGGEVWSPRLLPRQSNKGGTHVSISGTETSLRELIKRKGNKSAVLDNGTVESPPSVRGFQMLALSEVPLVWPKAPIDCSLCAIRTPDYPPPFPPPHIFKPTAIFATMTESADKTTTSPQITRVPPQSGSRMNAKHGTMNSFVLKSPGVSFLTLFT